MNLEGNEFNFDTLAHSLLIDPTSIIPTPLNVGLIWPNIRLINYIMSHALFTRNGNYRTVQKSYIPVVWFLENQVPKNWQMWFLTTCLIAKGKITPYIMPNLSQKS